MSAAAIGNRAARIMMATAALLGVLSAANRAVAQPRTDSREAEEARPPGGATSPGPSAPSAWPTPPYAASPWWTWPERLPYDAHQPVPFGYRIEEYHPKGLLIAGAITWGASYLAGFGLKEGNQNDAMLFVPLAGPWLLVPNRDYDGAALIACGIGQLVGASLLVGGLLSSSKRLVRRDLWHGMVALPRRLAGGYGFVVSAPIP